MFRLVRTLLVLPQSHSHILGMLVPTTHTVHKRIQFIRHLFSFLFVLAHRNVLMFKVESCTGTDIYTHPRPSPQLWSPSIRYIGVLKVTKCSHQQCCW